MSRQDFTSHLGIRTRLHEALYDVLFILLTSSTDRGEKLSRSSVRTRRINLDIIDGVLDKFNFFNREFPKFICNWNWIIVRQ